MTPDSAVAAVPGAPGTALRHGGRHGAASRLLLIAVLGLAACATPSSDPTPGSPTPAQLQARERQLAEIDHYRVRGGFSYWDDAQNLSADIDWQHTPERLAIALRAPLGLGRLDIEQDAAGARVARSRAAPRTGQDAGALLQSALGLDRPVPLGPLGDWIRGLPGESASAVRRDEQGRLTSLVWQDATGSRWRATVNRYRQVDGLSLPALLTAVNGKRHLRLALSDWTIGPDESSESPSRIPVPEAPSRLRLPGG